MDRIWEVPFEEGAPVCSQCGHKFAAIRRLAFKPSTDDIRSSVAIEVVRDLVAEGRNHLDRDMPVGLGFDYIGIGR